LQGRRRFQGQNSGNAGRQNRSYRGRPGEMMKYPQCGVQTCPQQATALLERNDRCIPACADCTDWLLESDYRIKAESCDLDEWKRWYADTAAANRRSSE
jgi:hypothetical protein